jgi:hypothetical protein
MSGVHDAGAGGRRLSAMQIGTLAVAIVLIGVSIAMIVDAHGFPAPMTLGAPGPARLPIVYAIALIALSAGLIATVFFGGVEPELHLSGGLQIVGLIIWTALYIFLMRYFHFVVLTVPWLFVATRMLGTSWRGSLITAVALPLFLFVSFGILLGIPLP